MGENEIGTIIVDSALELHRNLGPGLLESVYEVTLARALERRGLAVQRQVAVPIEYHGETFSEGFRADLIVERKVIIELKSIERVTPAHKPNITTADKLFEKSPVLDPANRKRLRLRRREWTDESGTRHREEKLVVDPVSKKAEDKTSKKKITPKKFGAKSQGRLLKKRSGKVRS
jgi:GxxExxY protein